MAILHLGVNDIPYVRYARARKKGGKGWTKPKKMAGTQTTGDVAGWLENKYHIIENFYEIHKQDIAKDLANSLSGAVESILAGADLPSNFNFYAEAESSIENRLKNFLSEGEMEKIGYPGVPTKAAQLGINHRLGSNRGAPRRSFMDTRLYYSSLRAKIDA